MTNPNLVSNKLESQNKVGVLLRSRVDVSTRGFVFGYLVRPRVRQTDCKVIWGRRLANNFPGAIDHLVEI